MRPGARSTAGFAAVADAARATAHPGLVLGVARFFHDPRGSMRGVLDSHPTEARILAYGMIAASLLLIGRLIDPIAGAARAADPVARTMEQAVSMLFFVPLVYYMLAALGTVIARLFGGRGRWIDGRAAFFWAALVSAPVMVLSGLISAALAGTHDSLVVFAAQIGPIFFAWALAQCFAEAFGFSRPGLVLAVIAAPVIIGLLGVLVLRS